MKEKIKQLEKENQMLKEIVDLQRKLLAFPQTKIIEKYVYPQYPHPWHVPHITFSSGTLTDGAISSGSISAVITNASTLTGGSTCSVSLNS